ncbi:hypothetical protein LP417_05700 [Polaromonas sp. P1-6]|nr:hypothetical protein LP417_05700 [Polaromonas sp. P1-6]
MVLDRMRLQPNPQARPLAWLVVFALLLAQTLGLIHGVVHGGVHAPQVTQMPQMQLHDGAQEQQHLHDHGSNADHDADLLASLFSSHDGDSDCRLFDQASHGHAAPALVPLVLPMMLSSLLVTISQGEVIARWAALFEARGPPLTR